jgi:NAD+ synthase (glutamine-hydrolysing)
MVTSVVHASVLMVATIDAGREGTQAERLLAEGDIVAPHLVLVEATHVSHYGVNAGVPKTLITFLIRWAAERVFTNEPAVSRVLESILSTPISPELLRPDEDGKITQRSEDLVGPYELHDFFLYYFLRFGLGPRRIARMALHAFDGRYSLAEIRRWLLVFLGRFFANQFKRDCLPDAAKVGSGGSLSPRGDWRMPSDASVTAWRAEAESIPEA